VPQRDTLELLRDEVNRQGGVLGPDGKRHPLEVIIYDDQSQPTTGVLAVTRLIEEDRVAAIICCATSPVSIAAVDVVTRAGVPMISTASSQAITHPPEERQWVFKPAWDNDQVVEALLRHFKKKGYSRIGIMSVNNEFGQSGKIAFEQLSPSYGIQLVLNETFNLGVTDLTPQVLKLRSAGADVLVLYANINETVVALKNLHDLGISVPVYVTNAVGTPAFVEAAGNLAEGVFVQTGKLQVYSDLPLDDPQRSTILSFVDLYRNRYGLEPPSFAGVAHDAFWLVVRAMEKVGTSRSGIRDAIEGTNNFVGVTGVLSFSPAEHTGFRTRDMVIAVIQNGKFRLYEVVGE